MAVVSCSWVCCAGRAVPAVQQAHHPKTSAQDVVLTAATRLAQWPAGTEPFPPCLPDQGRRTRWPIGARLSEYGTSEGAGQIRAARALLGGLRRLVLTLRLQPA